MCKTLTHCTDNNTHVHKYKYPQSNIHHHIPSSTFTSCFDNGCKTAFLAQQQVYSVESRLHRWCHIAAHMTILGVSIVHFKLVKTSRCPVYITTLQGSKSSFSLSVATSIRQIGIQKSYACMHVHVCMCMLCHIYLIAKIPLKHTWCNSWNVCTHLIGILSRN